MEKSKLIQFNARQKKYWFLCDICNHIFFDEVDLKDHANKHGDKKCYVCVEIVPDHLHRHEDNTKTNSFNFETYDTNSQRASSPTQVINTSSNDSFSRNSFTKNPKMNAQDLKNSLFTCCIQDYFSSFQELEKNEYQKHEKNIICETCGQIFFTQENFQCHQLQHQSEIVKCDVHGDSIRQLVLENHLLTHSRSFSCTQCGKTFKSNYTLWKHKETHSKSSDVQRRHRSLPSVSTPQVTQQTNKPQNSPICFCNICGKIFKECNFQKHLLVHTNRFLCTQCGKIFSRKYSLKRHETVHAKPGNRSRECDPSTVPKQQEKQQIDQPNKSQEWQCNICRKSFLKRNTYRHLQTHKRRFSCTQCGKTLATSWSLWRHEQIHSKYNDGSREHSEAHENVHLNSGDG
ncbi:zinc finger protein 547 [Procambarus clarkii]|uniref:zinc finger protein 547 n=1 Tax=Procambarus clarkii TaxID=6728 RepID=UPI00374364C5